MDRLIESLLQARLYDPFALLGLHQEGAEWVVRVYQPHATQVALISKGGSELFKRIHPAGVYELRGTIEPARPYRLRINEGRIDS